MQGVRFYELADDYAAIMMRIEDNGGELSPIDEAELDAIEAGIGAKVDAIAGVIREAQATADAFDSEAKRFADRARTARRKADGLKDYLHRAMDFAALAKVQGERFRVRIQRNGQPSVRWTRDAWELPDDFRRVIVEPDLSAAREALKSGVLLPEGFEVVLGTHLRIE